MSRSLLDKIIDRLDRLPYYNTTARGYEMVLSRIINDCKQILKIAVKNGDVYTALEALAILKALRWNLPLYAIPWLIDFTYTIYRCIVTKDEKRIPDIIKIYAKTYRFKVKNLTTLVYLIKKNIRIIELNKEVNSR